MKDNSIKCEYIKIISQQSAPDDLVNETIQMMHKEYEKKSQKTATKKTVLNWLEQLKQTPRLLYSMGGIAVTVAATILCIGTLTTFRSPTIPLNAPTPTAPVIFSAYVYQPDLRIDSGYKSEGDREITSPQEEIMDKRFVKKIGEYYRSEYFYHEFSIDSNSPTMWVANAIYSSNESEAFQVTVSNFETLVYSSLSVGTANDVDGTLVYAGEDARAGRKYIVWQSNECYIQLDFEQELPNDTMLTLIKDLNVMLCGEKNS